MHGNILNKDITSHIEIRMLPTPHPSWPPLSYCRKYANHIYVFYASDSVYYAGMNLYDMVYVMSPAAHMSVIVVPASIGESFV